MGKAFSNCCSSEIPANNLEVRIEEQEEKQNNKMIERSNNLLEAKNYSNQNSRLNSSASNYFDQHVEENWNDVQRLKKLEESLHTCKNLRLRVVSSWNLPKGTVYIINPQQMEGALRNAKDGVTYFGCKKRSKSSNPYYKSQEIINDFVLPSKDKETAKNHRGRHFQIWFEPFDQKYKIRDLGIGFGVFVKLNFVLKLKDNHLLHLGESFAVVNLLKDDENVQEKRLRIKLFGGPSNGDVLQELKYSFFKSTINESIKIGRHTSCEIAIDDNLLSKVQATVFYSNNK